MWFARKPKNRAFERRHVLDVKVARRQVRRMRARVATMAAGLSIGTIFVVYIAWRCGSVALDHFVYKNSAFAIQRIDLQTDGVISHEQLRQWAGVRKNDNLFALDLTRVKRDLELVAFVESASVERILPNALRLRVIEREPIARVQDHLIDRNGFLMMPLHPHQRSVPGPSLDHYPAIVGYNPNEVALGRETDSAQIRAALMFLHEFENSVMAAHVDIAKIDVSHPDVLQVTTLQQNQVTFANRDYERQLNRWWLVHKTGMQLSRQIATLDLSIQDYLPLRWFDVAAVPPTPAKVRKSSPYKKKHV